MRHPEHIPDSQIDPILAALNIELAGSEEQVMYNALRDRCPPDSTFALGNLFAVGDPRNPYNKIGRVKVDDTSPVFASIDVIHRDDTAPVPRVMNFTLDKTRGLYRIETPITHPERPAISLTSGHFLNWLDCVKIEWRF